MAIKTYKKFDREKEPLVLKKDDYKTWAIWKSGIPVRTVNALISQAITFDKKEALDWLNETEDLLKPATEYKYRINEIKTTKQKLQSD